VPLFLVLLLVLTALFVQNPHNIPSLVAVPGIPSSMQRPLLAYENGLHAYVFRKSSEDKHIFFVTIRGTDLGSPSDIIEDIRCAQMFSLFSLFDHSFWPQFDS
jgi:hypothetical protein